MSMPKSVENILNTAEEPTVVKQTIELQRQMLAKTKTDKVNHLSKFNQFDAVGSNGLFGAAPSIVRFAGFELRKIRIQFCNF